MKRLLSAAIGAVSLIAFSSFSQAQEDDPFGGGFAVNKNAEIFAMGTQNDSLHGWAFDWLSSPSDSIILIGESSFPESYLCGDKRDIAAADFNGDYMDELVVAWNRADGGVFVGIPTIDPGTLAPDPAGWHVSDPPGASGVLYATDALADVLGEIRVVAGNFYPDRAMEFVSAYLAADSTVTLTVFDVDSLTSIPAQMSTISDQAVSTALPALQQFGAVSRFDIAAGDFDGDGLDEIALIAGDPAQSPETHLALKIYDYDPSSHTLIPEPSIPYAANADVNHSCLRRVLMETGNFEPDSLDEIAILDHWSQADVDSSRVGTLHTLKLNTAMTGIAASQQQLLPSCSWGEGGGVNGYVGALTTYNGELIVGGGFSKAGYTPVNNIASWDGTRWKPLGSGVNNGVSALAVYEGDLIVAGIFTEAGGVHATNIARWDGSSWEEFAGGITDYGGVMALLPSTISLGDLYVVGRFTVVGGVGANNVARWDGSAWQPLGSGLDDMANNIIENADSSVTVVGQFDNAGGKAAHNIAKWSNGTWYSYGSGLDYPADAVIYDSVPGTTVVAGWFYNAGGNTANHIAFWDGAWHAVGPPGLNDEARALCLEPGGDGDFYVGGRFTTAGGTNANSIVRRNYGVSWQPLGKGLTYPSGSPNVYALYFHGGDLIAGGSFDHADDSIHAGSIARWDGSQWHAFESQEFFPIGLAVGRFNVNSELDDIAITACRAVSGYLMQYLCVYGVDTLSAPLTLCQKWEADISESWSVEGLARSRRLIAVDDVTGNGQADLAVLCPQSVAPGIRIYEPVPDALCTFSSMPAPEDWISSDNLTHLVLADLDTLTVTIGPPMTYHVDSVVQPLAIIYAPPVHYDTLNDTTWDVSNRYPLPPDDPYDTYVQYYNSSGFQTTTQTEMHRDWGVSVGLETWAETGGWSASAYLETEYGEGFSKQGGYSEQITIGATITAKDDDQLHAVRVSYDILEYPVLRGGETMGRIVVVSPSLVEQGWSPVKMRESLIPNHEVDNILSYPPPSDILNNPMMASGIIGNASEFYTMQAAAPSTWYLGQQRFTESSVSTSWDLTVEAGVSAGYEGGFKIFGMGVEAGFEVSLDANYGVGQVSTFSTSFSTTDSLHLELGLINSSGSYSGNRQYEVTPYAYWAKNGALVIDYAVSPLANPPGQDPTWWQIHYSTPDPAFILPWRLDNEKYNINDPEENRYRTKEIAFIPSHPAPGDSVLISARVHNFSLSATSGPVKVSFYLGNPANGGQILADKNSAATVFFACDTLGVPVPIAAQEWAIAEMVWQVPDVGSISGCQRIWAQIDPGNEIVPEVHDNDDWATNNRGWKLLFVNTDDVCIDTDGDGWEESAYRCHTCPHPQYGLGEIGDNCPTAYNPDQADNDEDGIGDACDEICCVGRVGDANGVGGDDPTIGDVSLMIDALFITASETPLTTPPACMDEADVNLSALNAPVHWPPVYEDITIGDISALIDALFITADLNILPSCP